MKHKTLKAYITVISSGRPDNVQTMIKHLGEEITFYVKKGEEQAYKSQGAKKVIGVVGTDVNKKVWTVSHQRNAAIKDAMKLGLPCVQSSDDLKAIKIAYKDEETGKIKRAWSTFDEILPIMLEEMETHDADYCAVGITDNALNYKEHFFSYNKLIVNDLIINKGEFLYDELADNKEDYDMFIRQILAGKTTVRCDNILCTFPHRENAGGCNLYRTYEHEKKCNQYIFSKHPLIAQPHKKRDNQIEINYKELYRQREENKSSI
jgi:hypothetical protein